MSNEWMSALTMSDTETCGGDYCKKAPDLSLTDEMRMNR